MYKIIKKFKNVVNKYKLTFEDISDEWLEFKKNDIKRSTYSNYSYNIKKYLIPELKCLNLRNLENYDFNYLVEKLSKELSPKTVKDILCNLKAILYFLEQEYDCKINIKKIKSPRTNLNSLVILSDKEIKKIEKYCLNLNTLKSIGIILCLNTGIRIGEICALKWQNIDLEKKELHINETLQRIYDKSQHVTKIIIDSAKTRTSIRTIPISNKLYNILIKFKDKYNKDDFFLTGNNVKSIEPRCYQNFFKDCLKKMKIRSYKFHILRHTFATKCIEAGMDIKSLSEILGHSSVEITLNRYVHSSNKRKKHYLEKLYVGNKH